MNRGRLVGLMLLVQLPLAPIANFALLRPVMGADYVAQAAGHASQVRGAVVLWLIYGAITLGVAAVAMPVFRRLSDTMATWFLALCVMSVVSLLIENVGLLSMLSVSQQAADAGSVSEGLGAVAAAVRSARIAAHFTNLMLGAAQLFLLYLILTRFALIPRVLAGAGVAASALLLVAATIPLLGYPVHLALMAPVGIANLAMIGILLVRGFREGGG